MPKGLIDWLRSVRDSFYSLKYRFDQGIQFLVFVNFALLIVTASDKLKPFFGIESTPMLVLFLIAASFVGVFVFGFFLDVFAKQQQRQEMELGKRSFLWQRDYDQGEKILKEIAELKKQLKMRK